MFNLVWAVAGPVLMRYAIAAISSGVAGASAWALSKGVSAEALAGLGAGVVGAGAVIAQAISRNADWKTILDRIPYQDMLDAVAKGTTVPGGVKAVVLNSETVAAEVPSSKVVGPEGNGSIAG